MKTRLILHDLPGELAEQVLPNDPATCTLFAAIPTVHYCVGCFGCWMKTPGKCVLKDRGNEFAPLIPKHNEFVIISRLVFGGVSPDVKALLDRCIGVLLPYFRILDGDMHHAMRNASMPDMRYLFYGDDMSAAEQATARRLVAANAVNLAPKRHFVEFYPSAQVAAQALALQVLAEQTLLEPHDAAQQDAAQVTR